LYVGTTNSNDDLEIYRLSGLRAPTGEVGALLANAVSILQSLRVSGSAFFETGLNVGQNAQVGGALTITGTASSSLLSAEHTSLAVTSGNVGIGTTSPYAKL